MRRVQRGKDGTAGVKADVVRPVRRKRASGPTAATVRECHNNARPLPATNLFTTSPIKLSKGKDYAPIPPVAFVHRLVVQAPTKGGRSFEAYEITPLDMQKKRKRDKVLGMPIYFSLASGENKIYLYPAPGVDLTATIEYKPVEVRT